MPEREIKYKVSVIVPVYNVETYISRCLDSLLQQTLDGVEIICVDDCSPDGSAFILDRYASEHDNIRVIHQTVNQGPMVARRDAYTVAAGEYLFFCDGDDFLPPSALNDLYKAATDSGADMTVGQARIAGVKGFGPLRRDISKFGVEWQSYLRYILNWGTAALWGILFRRELFDNSDYTAVIGMKQSEDRRLLTEILVNRHPRIAGIDKVVYYYWINPASTTRQRVSDAAVRSQFESLYGSYEFIERNSSEFTWHNDNQMLRYLSLYIESGTSPELLKSIHPHNEQLLRFSNMKRISGLKIASHTYLCMHMPFYRQLLHGMRRVIRRLQSKD